MNVFKNSAGQVIELAKELGRGGEGVVFDINCRPNQVAKIWHRPNRADSNAVRAYRDAGCKLEIMVANRPEIRTNGGGLFTQKHPFISWPDEILYNRNDEVVGFLMPKVDRSRFYESFHYFIPTARQDMETELNKTFRDKDFLLMARNLAEAVAEVHKSGYIIGDVNEKNVLINDQARVILVDSDSMQMRDSQTGELYRCTKGREDYTTPRLQGCNFGDVDRIQDDDRFGLAVLIFKMTMHGVHPYASRSDPANKNAIAELGEKIKLEYFPYNESGHTPEDYQPSDNYRRAWRDVNFEMRQLFRRAFDPDATNSSERPSPEEWIAELDRIIGLQARPGTRTAPQAPSAAAAAATDATHTIPQRQTDTPPRGRAIFSVTATVLTAIAIVGGIMDLPPGLTRGSSSELTLASAPVGLGAVAPTLTPIRPAAPTATLVPTLKLSPTNTTIPTATPIPPPTNTTIPTATPIPPPTSTTIPTATPIPPPTLTVYPNPLLMRQHGTLPSQLELGPNQYVAGCFVGNEPRKSYGLFLADRPSTTLENAIGPIYLKLHKIIRIEDLREVKPGKCYYVGPINHRTNELHYRCPGTVYEINCSRDDWVSRNYPMYDTGGTLLEITQLPDFGNLNNRNSNANPSNQ